MRWLALMRLCFDSGFQALQACLWPLAPQTWEMGFVLAAPCTCMALMCSACATPVDARHRQGAEMGEDTEGHWACVVACCRHW